MSILNFIKTLEEESFVEAHEVLEDEWRSLKKQNLKQKAKAVQGLINGATSLALYKKGRIEAYERVWKVYEKYKHLLKEVDLDNLELYIKASLLLEKKRDELVLKN